MQSKININFLGIIFVLLVIFCVSPASAYQLEKRGDMQEARILQSLREPLQVVVKDSSGAPVEGIKVLFEIACEPQKSYLVNDTVYTNEEGIASTVFVLGKEMGEYYVNATLVSEAGDIQEVKFESIAIDPRKIIFWVVGGLGLFLFGMKMMSEGLQKVAGKKIKSILHMLTSNRFIGVLVGTLVTAIIQSSSATTVMVVGFINAGLLNLTQSIGVILGANIGTTVTAQIISFKIYQYALPAVGLGFGLMLFSRRKSTQFWGQVLLGFGLLFLGMTTMKDVVHPLRNSPTFAQIFINFSHYPLLGVLAGIVITVLVQSSSATIGLTMALAGAGLFDIQAAIPIILGDNIGTTVTAQLACIGGTRSAKRAAMAHSLFNVIGTFYLIILLYVYPSYVNIIKVTSSDIERQIANFHTFFNVFNTIVFLPLVGVLRNVVVKLVPGKEEEIEITEPIFLEKHLLATPAIALEQIAKEISVMTKISHECVEMSFQGFFEKDPEKIAIVGKKEEIVDQFRYAITEYIGNLSATSLSEEESFYITRFLHLVANLEKTSDHSENIAFISQKIVDKRISFPQDCKQELEEMADAYLQMSELILNCFENPDSYQIHAKEVLKIEERLDTLKGKLRKHHMNRLKEKSYTNVLEGVMFMDVVSNLERMGDHLTNIAEIILEDSQFLYDAQWKKEDVSRESCDK